MKLFVTGGAGYIGSIVTEHLLAGGHDVAVYDNLCTGHREAVPHGAVFIQGDVRDRAALEKVMPAETEAVLHFAASSIVSESVKDPLAYFDNNVGGAVNLLRVMQEKGIDKIVFSSSAAVYGSPSRIPITEGESCKPENPYGYTKLFIEHILETCERAWGLKHVSLRYFNAAGSTESHGEDHRPETHLMPIVLDVALGRREKLVIYGDDYETADGTCVRDYIHVVDLARAHVLALDALGKGFTGPLNLGSEKPFSVLDIVEAVEKVTGRTVEREVGPRRSGDPPTLLASSRKAEEILGWKKTHSSIEQIISSAYRWRLDHPQGYGD